MDSRDYSSYEADIISSNFDGGGTSTGCRQRSSSMVVMIILVRLSIIQAV